MIGLPGHVPTVSWGPGDDLSRGWKSLHQERGRASIPSGLAVLINVALGSVRMGQSLKLDRHLRTSGRVSQYRLPRSNISSYNGPSTDDCSLTDLAAG